MYGDQNIGKYKSVILKVHEYFSITLYYTKKDNAKVCEKRD